MRYIFGILATIGLIILILVLLLRGGNPQSSTKPLVLSNYADSGSAAEFTIDGPVRADQEHNRVTIHVDANEVRLTVYNGYENHVSNEQSYSNNVESYTVFLKALQNEGFTLQNKDVKLKDERGVCPLGQRGIYSFDNGTKEAFRTWSSSCGTGTFKGQKDAIRTLFQRQVPDYSAQIRGVNITS
jgi:hypothetical protein